MTIPAPWRCPDCHRMNAPHVDHCDCQPSGIITTAPTTGPLPMPPQPYRLPPWPNWPRPYVGDTPDWMTVTVTSTSNPPYTAQIPISSSVSIYSSTVQ